MHHASKSGKAYVVLCISSNEFLILGVTKAKDHEPTLDHTSTTISARYAPHEWCWLRVARLGKSTCRAEPDACKRQRRAPVRRRTLRWPLVVRIFKREQNVSFSCSCMAGLRKSIHSTTSLNYSGSTASRLPTTNLAFRRRKRAIYWPVHFAFGSMAKAAFTSARSFRMWGNALTTSAFINSMHGSNSRHGSALLELHTGSDTFIRPSMGSWITYGLGSENENLPGFITICPTLGHSGSNAWSSAFSTCPLRGHAHWLFQHESRRCQDWIYQESRDWFGRLNVKSSTCYVSSTNKHLLQTGPDDALESRIESFELAFRMQTAAPEIQGHLRRNRSHKKTLWHRPSENKELRNSMFNGPTLCRSWCSVHPSHP